MAKDPAFLFYSSDFLTGTMFMSNEDIGIYIKLLCVQHQNGVIYQKDMSKICMGHSEVMLKFQVDEKGNFFNARLREEIEKRLKYSESRRNNRNRKKDMNNISNTYVAHMENENENRNKDINLDKEGVVGETNQVAKIPPDFKYVQEYFKIKGHPEEAERFYNYYQSNGWKVGKNKMKDWKAATRTWLINKKTYQKNGSNTEITEPKFGRLPISELENFVKYGNPIRSQGDTTREQ